MQEIVVPMKGLQGYKKIDIPSNYQYEYKFITIINITDNSVCLYPANFTEPLAGASIICTGQYSCVTIPLISDLVMGFNVVWTNPTGSNPDLTKTVKLIFSEENLNYNSSFAPSFVAGGDVFNTAIVADDVGIAKANQLPRELTPSGNLKIGIVEDIAGLAKANQLPAALTTAGNLKIGIVEDIAGLAKANQLPAALTTAGNLKIALAENLIDASEQTLLASAARTASGDTSATPVNVKRFKEANFFLDVTAVAGTEPTLDVAVKSKDPASGKWFDLVTFTQATGVTSEMKSVAGNLGSLIVVFYTIGGTSPSFTFSVGAVLK